MRNELKQHIDSLIQNNAVVLFMKGSKERPQCGFSKQIVEVLNKTISEFVTVDVLADPEIREGIKIYSNWPTIPQLFIDGEFVGGCDIVLDLFNKNELQDLLHVEKATNCPKIEISDAALNAFKNAYSDAQELEKIRLSIGIDFEHGLNFDRKLANDFSVQKNELEIIIDPYSAVRADNLFIDYLTESLESGFSFENPNEPPLIKELSVEELSAWHRQNKDMLLIDVRPQSEWDCAHISFAKPLSQMNKDDLTKLKKEHTIVFHCHHGSRSKRVAESFRLKGFTNLFNLTGGIDAWSKKIDSSVPIYSK